MENKDSLNCIKIIAEFPTIYQKGNQTPSDIVIQSGYSRLFSSVTIENISEYLNKNSNLIEVWLKYSEDIRHSPAWSFEQTKNGTWTVTYGKDGKSIDIHKYSDPFTACAKMIKMTFEEMR